MMQLAIPIATTLVATLLLCLTSSNVVEGGSSGVWRVRFDVANLATDSAVGSFVVEVHDDWAPLGAARFREMVDSNFFTGIRFFRVVPGFMAQFGIHGDPAVSAKWRSKNLRDDPVTQSNKRGFISFAMAGKNTRTTQLFINFVDRNAFLDSQGFSPFARVVSGMELVDHIFSEYREKTNQHFLQMRGNQYLNSEFPKLTYITSARIVSVDGGGDNGEEHHRRNVGVHREEDAPKAKEHHHEDGQQDHEHDAGAQRHTVKNPISQDAVVAASSSSSSGLPMIVLGVVVVGIVLYLLSYVWLRRSMASYGSGMRQAGAWKNVAK